MKRVVLGLMLGLLLASLTIGQEACPEQQFLPLTGLDPNQILTDPITGQKCMFQPVMRAYTGKPINLFIKTCDDDLRDPNAPPQTMRLWREPEGNEIPINPDTGEGHIVVQFDKKGTYYIGFGLTDGEIIRMGSIVLDITQMNKPPVLGGCRMLQ